MKQAKNVLSAISNKLQAMAKDAYTLIGVKNNADKAAADKKELEKIEKEKEKLQKKANKLQPESEGSMDESVDSTDIALSAKLILEAANLLREDAEDYVDGNEGGEGTTKEIDEIPEEKPETTGEYPADDITGGEGEKIDQEEIKDLLDGDSEAIAILNDDEGSKAITESVIISF